jgi:creatinine amidohydrolase
MYLNCQRLHGLRSLELTAMAEKNGSLAMLAYYPDLIHLDRAHDEVSSAGHGAEGPGNTVPGQMTGYSGDASGATATRGHALVELMVVKVVKFIRDVKADNTTLVIQEEFYQHMENPQNPDGSN